MFDYQAGEKFKLTLIMVGIAGLMAGMFFTMLLLPSSEPPHRQKALTKADMDPDVTGGGSGRHKHRGFNDGGGSDSQAAYAKAQGLAAATAGGGQQQQQAQLPQTPVAMTDPNRATQFLEQWLPTGWDLSAATAGASQEKAMMFMTPECATAYRQNIWTADLAKQIQDSGLQSTFNPRKVAASQPQPDGSVVIYVEGDQVMVAPGKETATRPVNMEYLVKETSEGLRIAGITEGHG